MNIKPIILQGDTVILEPLSISHVDDLTRVGCDPKLWQWIPAPVSTREDMLRYVQAALDDQLGGSALPFVIKDYATKDIIGSTRFGSIEKKHRRLEIGWSWIIAKYQRTRANTEAKFLLLTHAFEQLGANRVEFKTDSLNQKSRAAITRIGAIEEGTLRQHMVTSTGRIRDTVYFSIIANEWPKVCQHLQNLLKANYPKAMQVSETHVLS